MFLCEGVLRSLIVESDKFVPTYCMTLVNVLFLIRRIYIDLILNMILQKVLRFVGFGLDSEVCWVILNPALGPK